MTFFTYFKSHTFNILEKASVLHINLKQKEPRFVKWLQRLGLQPIAINQIYNYLSDI